jgi:hypothetical protein
VNVGGGGLQIIMIMLEVAVSHNQIKTEGRGKKIKKIHERYSLEDSSGIGSVMR